LNSAEEFTLSSEKLIKLFVKGKSVLISILRGLIILLQKVIDLSRDVWNFLNSFYIISFLIFWQTLLLDSLVHLKIMQSHSVEKNQNYIPNQRWK
jgi:hypothetical protein